MDVDTTSVDGIWWRQIPGGGDVHYRPPHPPDGRWQHGAVTEALYFADSPETAWAEWYRFLAEAGVPPNMALPRDLWRWEVAIDRVADLSTEARLARAGLPEPTPGRHQWPAFQAAGDRIFGEGHSGLLAPSAARPAGKVLCLFREDEQIDGALAVPPPEELSRPPLVPPGMTT